MQITQSYKEALAPNGIFYRLYGADNSGPPIVMIMGYGGCMFAWPLQFVSRLSQHHKVLIFDNRGTGRSAPLTDGVELRITNFAQDLKVLLDHLNFATANLFGYSMGGCVALQFANEFPQSVHRLILQSTTAGGALYTGSDAEVKERLANPRGSNFDEMLFDFFDLCMGADALKQHRPVLDGICTNARPYPTSPKVLQPQLKAFRHFDASEFAGQLQHQVLLFHGKNDRILRVRNGERLAENLPNCNHVFFDDCGHCPHIEHEDSVFENLMQFLK